MFEVVGDTSSTVLRLQINHFLRSASVLWRCGKESISTVQRFIVGSSFSYIPKRTISFGGFLSDHKV